VVLDNTVKYYAYNNGWHEDKRFDFALPSGYKGVFLFGNGLGVVMNNTIKYYSYNNGWHEDKRFEFVF
jgi:hypothetical protein